MRQVKLRGTMVAVAKIERKVDKTAPRGFIVPEIGDDTGEVKYVSDFVLDLKPGDQVYFGPNREPIRMQGLELFVMEESNVYGKVVTDGETEDQAKP